MDRINQYEKIILEVLGKYQQLFQSNEPAISVRVVADRDGKHYQLLRYGWTSDMKFVHYAHFHIDIIDDKIWIQQNTTDVSIAEELERHGIKKSEIVLGVIFPYERQFTEYAAA